jgi:hypothetical protein
MGWVVVLTGIAGAVGAALFLVRLGQRAFFD